MRQTPMRRAAPGTALASLTVVTSAHRLRLHWFAILAVAALTVATPALATSNPVDATVQAFARTHPDISALVTRLDASGPVAVAAVNADESFAPASTMKIITSASALLTMGPDFQFTTRVEGAAPVGGVVQGPAYLIGAGDPLLSTRAFSRGYLGGAGTPIERLASNIRASGTTSISGGIIVDESLFDSRRTGPQWRSNYVWECGPLSAIAINQGRAGNDEVRNAPFPAIAAGQRLVTALRRVGVTVHGTVRKGANTPGGDIIGEVKSKPLSAILEFMNPASNNFASETLTKDVGAYAAGHGTTAAGTAQAEKILREQGALAPGDDLVDGSGLSHANRLSASTLVTMLGLATTQPEWGDPLIRSLARGGEGTLIRRLRDPAVRNRIRAKTGYIDGVASLAGTVTSISGARYAFAFLINDPDIKAAQRTMDRAVTLLATGAADSSPEVPS